MQKTTYHFIRNATAILTYNNMRLLLDPMLSDKGTLPSFAGLAANPTVDLPVSAGTLVEDIDTVIVSHLHGDHLDGAAIQLLDKSLPVITPRNTAPLNPRAPEETVRFKEHLQDLGFTNVSDIGEEEGDFVAFGGITLHQVFARHGRGLVGEAMGGVNGLVFEAEGWPTIYWAGDTILDDDGRISGVLEQFRPDIVIAHTGGPVVSALSPEILLMDAKEAREFFKLANQANPNVQIVAIHMDALDHCFSTREDLRLEIGTMEEDLQSRIHVPADGEQIAFL